MSKTKSRPAPAIKITLPVLEQLIAKQAEVQAAMTAEHVVASIRKLAAVAQSELGAQSAQQLGAQQDFHKDRQAFETHAEHRASMNGHTQQPNVGKGIGGASTPGPHVRHPRMPPGGWAEQARPIPPPGNPPPMPRVVDAIEEFNRTVNALEELPQLFRSALVGILPPDFEIPSVPSATIPTTSPNVSAVYMLTRRVENIHSQLKIVLSALTL